MTMLPFRAFVSDMDGTLLNGNHVIGEFTRETLEKLAHKGVDIILATGRGYADVLAQLNMMNIENAAMVTSNGAEVHDLKGNLLYSNYLPEDLAFEIMQEKFDEQTIFLNSYQDNDWFISTDVPSMAKYHKDSGFSYQVVDFSQHHGCHTQKIFFIGKTLEDLLPLEQRLKEKYGDRTSIIYSTPQCLEVMNKNVSKASALAELVTHKAYDLSDCIAFGDGLNDIEMLSEVGKGLVMGNADPRLKSILPDLEQIGLNTHESVASYVRAVFGIY